MPENRLRTRIDPDGTTRLPEEVLSDLGWKAGAFLEILLEKDAVRLRRVEVDLFAEALREPDPESFEKILAKQKKRSEEARRLFEERTRRDPPADPSG